MKIIKNWVDLNSGTTEVSLMHKKFEINQAKIKGGCQSGRKVVPHDSKI